MNKIHDKLHNKKRQCQDPERTPKDLVRRAGACLLAGVMAVSLAACGKGGAAEGNTGDGKNAQNTTQPEYRFVAEYVDLDVDGDADFYRARFVGDQFYYMTYNYDETAHTTTQTLHVYDLQTQKETKQFTVSQNQDGEEQTVSSYLENYVVRADGSLAVIEATYDYRNQDNPQRNLSLILYNTDHEPVQEMNLLETISADSENFYINQFLCDSEDRLYMIGDTQIYLFDASLAYKGSVDFNGSWISQAGQGKDGKAYVSMYDQASSSQVVKVVDFEQKKLGDAHTGFISAYNGSLVPGLERDLLINDGTRVFDYSLEENQATALFSWLDCDIYGENVQQMVVTDDGRIAVTIRDWDANETSLAYLKKVKAEELPQKTQITVGSLYTQGELEAAAVAFNKQSDKYHVSVTYYLDENRYEENAWKDAVASMNSAIVSADAPDMVWLSYGSANVPALAAQGAFEDLSGYLAWSSVVHAEDYLDNILQGSTFDGKLICIPKHFYVETLVGKSRLLGKKETVAQTGWTVSDIMQLSKEHPDAALFQYATKESMLQTLLAFDGDAFIDYAAGTCRFDSEEFTKLLEFVADFPDDYDWSREGDSLPTLLATDKVLLNTVYLSNFQDLQVYPAMFGEPVSYVGYPTTDGSVGCILRTEGSVAITAKAHDKEGAWAFMEYYLTSANNRYDYNFPTSRKAMQEMVEKELTVEYIKDENGELVLDEDGNPIPEDNHGGIGYDDWKYTYHNSTKEEIEQVQQILQQAKPAVGMDDQILTMITEEAAPFFQKQKSVQDVAKVIQSRVQLYLNENR